MHGIRMTEKELKKCEVLQLVEVYQMTRLRAAEKLEISLRQIDRLRIKLRLKGLAGIAHGNRGRKSNNMFNDELKNKILLLVQKNYYDFGPSFAAEKLLMSHGIKISKEKLRQLMIEEGLWKANKRKRKKCFQRRLRRSHYGDLVQGDASPHNWFEGRRDRCALVAIIDDATNRAYGKFFESETTEAYSEVMQNYLLKYGSPRSLYVDKHGIFRINNISVKEARGDTQFGRMMKELDIQLICAHSPQAKGRIERLFCTLQDRLVKEMRLLNINSIEKANEYLEKKFWKEFNKRWSRLANEPENFHRKSPPKNHLERVFTVRHERKISKSLDFSFKGTLYQIDTKIPNRLIYKPITIFEKFDSTFWVEFEGKKLNIKAFKEVPYATPIEDYKTIDAFLNRRKPLTIIERHRKRIGYPK